MIKKRWFGAGANLCALMTLCLAGTLSHGAVTAAPPTVTFTSPTQSATITLTSNGAVIPARDIRGWKFIASGHDYRRMLSVEKKEGALKIAPSKTLEVGSYDLNIETAAGPVTVLVLATLSDMPDVVEKTAALTGQSEQKTKENMGMSTTIASEAVQPTPPNAKLTPTLETATDTTVNTETIRSTVPSSTPRGEGLTRDTALYNRVWARTSRAHRGRFTPVCLLPTRGWTRIRGLFPTFTRTCSGKARS